MKFGLVAIKEINECGVSGGDALEKTDVDGAMLKAELGGSVWLRSSWLCMPALPGGQLQVGTPGVRGVGGASDALLAMGGPLMLA